MKKINKFILNLINKGYFLVLGALLIVFLLLIYHSIFIGKLYNNIIIKPLFVLLLSVTYFFAFAKLRKFLQKKVKNDNNKVAIIMLLISFLVMLWFSTNITIIPNRDLSKIIPEAKNLLINKHLVNDVYFYTYSNQIGLLFVVKCIYNIASLLHMNLNTFACLISCLLISLSMFLTYLTIKKVSSKVDALTFLIYLLFNPMYYLLASFYYSDIFAMPIMCLLVYLLIGNNESDNLFSFNLKNALKYIFVGFFSYIGFKIRAVVIFILIAYIIKMLQIYSFKNIIKRALIIMTGFILAFGSSKLIERKYNIYYEKDLEFPPTHWIMMGLNYKNDGMWNQADYDITFNQKTSKDKKNTNIAEIKSRIKSNGIYKLLLLQDRKLKTNWAYGDSAYSTYYNNVTNINKLYNYIVGNRTIILSYILQYNRVVLYIMLSLSVLYELKNKDRKINVVAVTIFGAFLFYFMWEVYPRYSLCFMPLLTMLAAFNFKKYTDSKNLLLNNKKFLNCALYAIKFAIIMITILVFITNYDQYVKIKHHYKQRAAYSYVGGGTEGSKCFVNSERELKQTFYTNLTFNSIVLKMNKEGNPYGNLYFKMYDDKNKELISQTKKISNIVDNDYLGFRFKKSYKTNGKLYYFTISTDLKEDDKLSVLCINEENLDYFPQGSLFINGKEEKFDLQMNINKVKNSSILSKKVYLLLASFVIFVQLYVFDFIKIIKKLYLYLKKRR